MLHLRFKTVSLSLVLVAAAYTAGGPTYARDAVATLLSQSVEGRTTIAVDPRFRAFGSQDEAFAWASDFETNVHSRLTGLTPRALVSQTDPRYAITTPVVEAVWEAYRTMYPSVIADQPAPYTVLIQDDGVDAYTVFDERTKQVPLAFFISTAAIAAPKGAVAIKEGALYGLVAHELAHLVLLHMFPGVDRDIHYKIVPGHEVLGFQQVDVPALKGAFDQWLTNVSQTGLFPYEELNGIPAPGFSKAFLKPLLTTQLKNKSIAQTGFTVKPACTRALDSGYQFDSFVESTYDKANSTWPLDASLRANLNAITTKLVADGTECFAEGPSFFEAIEDMLHVHLSENDKDVFKALVAPEDQGKLANLMQGIVAVTKKNFVELRTLESQNDFSVLRVRTYEEEADDNSMLVAHYLGKDPKGVANYMLDVFFSAGERASCLQTLAEGKVPPYYEPGAIGDPHHGRCYRVFHVNLFNRLVFANP